MYGFGYSFWCRGGFVLCMCIACLRTRKDKIPSFFSGNECAMWMCNFLSFLKFTEVTGSVLLIYLTDGGIQFRNRLISHAS